MKRIMSAMLALTFITGAASMVFAQDAPAQTKKASKKKSGKKKKGKKKKSDNK
ncbi:MAG TPA: hypothetical protein VFW83_02235 [Bryobacteraceae bacterium]|nr:hypothetical protein [Bryobacteraceae bacterium]